MIVPTGLDCAAAPQPRTPKSARSQGEGIATLHGMFISATPWKKSSEDC
jgi:hypothetical protein